MGEASMSATYSICTCGKPQLNNLENVGGEMDLIVTMIATIS